MYVISKECVYVKRVCMEITKVVLKRKKTKSVRSLKEDGIREEEDRSRQGNMMLAPYVEDSRSVIDPTRLPLEPQTHLPKKRYGRKVLMKV